MFTRSLGVVQKYDHDLQKMLTDPLAMSNPNAINGLIDQRNSAARSMSAMNPSAPAIPELELTQIVDPTADPTKPLADRQSFALRMKQAPQEQPGQAAAPSRQAPAMPQGAPLQTQDPNAGLAPRQQRPDFRAAVGNPLGALPADLQQAIQDPNRPIPLTSVMQSYVRAGYSPEEANVLADALKAQLMGPPPTPTGTPQQTPAYQ